MVWLASLHTYVLCGHACACVERRRALGAGADDCVSSEAGVWELTVGAPASRAMRLRGFASPGPVARVLLASFSSLCGLSEYAHFTVEQARAAGERIGIEWATSPFDVEQFRMGMDVELEHGTRDLETNVTDDDVTVTAKIARAHLNEFPDYYSRLAVMEAEAEAHWAAQGE